MYCRLCDTLITDEISNHHLVPKSEYYNNTTVPLHKECHIKIHQLFSNKVLSNHYNTIDKLKTSKSILRYLKYINKNYKYRG